MTEPTRPYQQASTRILDFLRGVDTCAVSDAIESFNVRVRSEGYIQGTAQCQFPLLPPVAGYAVTARIRSSSVPIANVWYYHRKDWWDYVASFPSPKIMVIEDIDRVPGIGAFLGESHARISKVFGCVAYVTNGSIRSAPALEAAGFQCFASSLSVSHSYAHIIDFGEPVEIGGLKISPGDLLHGDVHGVHSIPLSIAEALPEAVKCILDRRDEVMRFCESPDFSVEKLTAILKREIRECPLDPH